MSLVIEYQPRNPVRYAVTFAPRPVEGTRAPRRATYSRSWRRGSGNGSRRSRWSW